VVKKKTILLLILAVGLIIVVIQLFFRQQKNTLTTPNPKQIVNNIAVSPSKTSKTYSDPAGFSFNYPDNLSLTNNEAESPTTYADIKLISKDVVGSLDLKISDTNFTKAEDWLGANNISQTPKEVKLGKLKAVEIITDNKLLLGAIDQGVLFTIEVSFEERGDFWKTVYNIVLTDFSFVQPESTAQSGASEIIFEGEEVVE